MNATSHATALPLAVSRQGLLAVFGSTLFQLSGIFMLSPLMLLVLKRADISTTLAGLFAATTWLGIFIMTPFASQLTQKLGRRTTMWLASTMPILAAVGFMLTDDLWLWFALELLAGITGALRWVLAEAFIAEFAPPGQTGRYIGSYATMVGMTFVIGPALLAWVGTDNTQALWVVIALLVIGLLWTSLIPRLPPAHDNHTAGVGLRGLWHALRAHPVIMLAGFVGGFYELGLASTLPLYGLTLGLTASASALLVAVSGVGGTLMALPSGMLADRFKSPARGRRTLMTVCTALILLSTCVSPFLHLDNSLVWPVVAVWGAAGGALYTLSMIDIASRDKGLALVNSTAVLVLTYTLGGLVASGASGALMDASPLLGLPALLIGVAALGLAALFRHQHTST
jgi:MFS family permease